MDENKFFSKDKNDFTMPACNMCKHHIGGDKCKAFKKIPIDILVNIKPHVEVIEGQLGEFVFELDESENE